MTKLRIEAKDYPALRAWCESVDRALAERARGGAEMRGAMRRAMLGLAAVATIAACGGGAGAAREVAGGDRARLRDAARGSSDGEVVGKWLLMELAAPGGDAKEAASARKRLDAIHHERALGDRSRARSTPRCTARRATRRTAYVATLVAARASEEPMAPLAAWYATHHLLGLRGAVSELYRAAREGARRDRRRPRACRVARRRGARGVGDRRGVRQGRTTGDAYDAMVREKTGCARAIAMAGPFGHGSVLDRRARRSTPRGPGRGRRAWPDDPLRGSKPHVLTTEQPRCLATSTENVEDGVFYAQTFVTTKGERDLLVAVGKTP